MAYFSDRDRAIIEALTYDPTSEPSYESIRSALVWPDERPDNLTSEGYQSLCDLWICRALIHRGDPTFSTSLDPAIFQRRWAAALADNIRWPGFERLTLSAKDRAYYEKAMREEAEAGEI
jgi:hypothetical protein